MVLIQVRGVSLEQTTSCAELIAKAFRSKATLSVEVSEAAAAPLERAHGQYRYHVALKSKSGSVLGKLVHEVTMCLKLPRGVIMTVDVDPYSLM
jgi:primosomal protein N' (replication factor Y)